jgi:Protein kinase domain/HEAT repeats
MAAGESLPFTVPTDSTLVEPESGCLPAPGSGHHRLPTQFGRYRLVRQLGAGGMGTVWLAQDTDLDRPVALKMPRLQPGDGPQVLERFYQEARAAAHLSHPNICPVHDVGSVDGVPYLTMAFIEGVPLSDRLRRPGAGPDEPGVALSPPEAVRLALRLAVALEEAHRRGVIHRDLKPANVMMNERGEPVIMDFGLARRADGGARITQEGSVMGTPAYMAPEQVAGDIEAMGPGTDIYSLGVILYEMLTGTLPFQGSLATVLSRVLHEEPAPLTTHRPELDPTLDSLCRRALAKQPDHRYRGMKEFREALEDYLQGRGQEALRAVAPTEVYVPSVHATPPTTGRVRRRWLIAGTVAGVLLGLGLVGHRVIWQKTAKEPAANVIEKPAPIPPVPPLPRVFAQRPARQEGRLLPPLPPGLPPPPVVILLERRVASDRWAGDDRERQKALADLEALPGEWAVVALRKALRSSRQEVRVWAARELGRYQDADVGKDLAGALEDGCLEVRIASADALARRGNPDATTALVRRIGDDLWKASGVSPDLSKEAALKALEKLASDQVPEALRAALRSENKEVSRWAARHLAVLKVPRLPPVAPILPGPRPRFPGPRGGR